jgi:hypothetical protein
MTIRVRALQVIIASFLALVSCRSDFEVNEPWKEIDIIYGLLDVNDTVQYIKINKAFLNEDEDVYKLASVEDSLYHKDSLAVTLQPVKNGVPQGAPVKLTRVYHTEKDSGVFAYPGQYLYATASGYKLDVTATYNLEVRNTETGVTATASTPVAQNAFIDNPTTQVSLANNAASRLTVDFISGKGVRFYDLTMIFHYEEYSKATNKKIKDGIVSWPVFTNLYSNPDQSSRLKYSISGPDFFRVVMQQVEIKGDVYRKIPAKPFEFNLTGGGSEIYNYMSVNQPSIGIVQKKPEYTNVNNGYGIFSTRNRQHLVLSAAPNVVADLKKLEGYNFVE